MQKVVAFDLDGTLVQSDLHLIPAYRRAIEQMGMAPKPDEMLLQAIGGTAEDIWQLLMPDQPFSEFKRYERFVVENAAETVKKCGRAYDHISKALAALQSCGYLTVLCSNGEAHYIEAVLTSLGLAENIDCVQKLQPGNNKSQLLASILRDFDAVGHAAMVGDRKYDAQAARDNGVPFIGCAYGLFPAEIEAAKADVVLYSPAGLPDAVEGLLGER